MNIAAFVSLLLALSSSSSSVVAAAVAADCSTDAGFAGCLPAGLTAGVGADGLDCSVIAAATACLETCSSTDLDAGDALTQIYNLASSQCLASSVPQTAATLTAASSSASIAAVAASTAAISVPSASAPISKSLPSPSRRPVSILPVSSVGVDPGPGSGSSCTSDCYAKAQAAATAAGTNATAAATAIACAEYACYSQPKCANDPAAAAAKAAIANLNCPGVQPQGDGGSTPPTTAPSCASSCNDKATAAAKAAAGGDPVTAGLCAAYACYSVGSCANDPGFMAAKAAATSLKCPGGSGSGARSGYDLASLFAGAAAAAVAFAAL